MNKPSEYKKQKINDQMGNPIEVGIVVVWRVVNTARALFNVDNYETFLSIQADSTLRPSFLSVPIYLPNKVSTRASLGLITRSPKKGSHPIESHTIIKQWYNIIKISKRYHKDS